MADDHDEAPPIEVVDPEMRAILGMFDVPAFARRGQDLEFTLRVFHDRLRRQRDEWLEMVRMRLRQWSAAVEGPEAWRGHFAGPLEDLWRRAGGEPPTWSNAATPRRRRAIARDLIASVERFNLRWARRLERLELGPINAQIDRYNRYYLLEKECVLRSARLAARHFSPRPRLTVEGLLGEYPPLPPVAPAES